MQENAGFGQTTVTLAHPDAADCPFVSVRHIRNNFYLFRICPYLNVLYMQVRFHPRPNFEKCQKFGTDEISVTIRNDMQLKAFESFRILTVTQTYLHRK